MKIQKKYAVHPYDIRVLAKTVTPLMWMKNQIYYDPTNVTPITSSATQNGYQLGYVYSNQMATPKSVTAGATGAMFTYLNYNGGSMVQRILKKQWAAP